jgi:hypothetical protein
MRLAGSPPYCGLPAWMPSTDFVFCWLEDQRRWIVIETCVLAHSITS